MTNTNQKTAIDIVGHYTCEGGDYRGEVVIRDIGDSFAVHWVINGAVQAGVGIRASSTLAVSVAVPVAAIAVYEIHEGPSLHGRYCEFPSGGRVCEEILSFVRRLRTWQIGDALLAKWSRDPFWYPATVIEKTDDDHYGVRFADGDEEWVGRARMAPDLLTVGDFVYNTSGVFHRDELGQRKSSSMDLEELDAARIGMRCRIIGREGSALKVQYADGATFKTVIENIRTMSPREG